MSLPLPPSLTDFSLRHKTDLSDERNPLADRIYRILTPSYFRIGVLDTNTESMLRKKIELAIQQQEPITFIIGMGWGKNWRSYSAPHINWAEFFHFKFLYDTLGQISSIYEPGVRLEFTPDDLAVVIINNYKQEWLDVYKSEFIPLLSYFSSQTPDNFTYHFEPSSHWYEEESLRTEIEKEVETMLANPAAEKAIAERLPSARNNFVGGSTSTEEEIRRSVLVHKAWLSVDYKKRGEYLEGGTHIPIAHRKGIPGTYNIRNVKSSLVQFWKGEGILRQKGERSIPDIISPRQFSEHHSRLCLMHIDNPASIAALDTIPVLTSSDV